MVSLYTPAMMKVVFTGSSISANNNGEETKDLVSMPMSLTSFLNFERSFQSFPYADWPYWPPILITFETTVESRINNTDQNAI